MIQTQDNGKVRVEDYGLAEFMKQVQEQIQKGFELDLVTNEGYPQNFGSLYTCLLNPVGKVEEKTKSKPDEVIPPLPVVDPELLEPSLPEGTEVVSVETEPYKELIETPIKIDGRTKQARNK